MAFVGEDDGSFSACLAQFLRASEAAFERSQASMTSMLAEIRELRAEFRQTSRACEEELLQAVGEYRDAIRKIRSPQEGFVSPIPASQNINSETEIPTPPVLGKIRPHISPFVRRVQFMDLPTRTVDDLREFAFDGSSRDTQLFDPGGTDCVKDCGGLFPYGYPVRLNLNAEVEKKSAMENKDFQVEEDVVRSVKGRTDERLVEIQFTIDRLKCFSQEHMKQSVAESLTPAIVVATYEHSSDKTAKNVQMSPNNVVISTSHYAHQQVVRYSNNSADVRKHKSRSRTTTLASLHEQRFMEEEVRPKQEGIYGPEDFYSGDLVWGKSGRNEPFWPAIVIDPMTQAPELVLRSCIPDAACVMFFGHSGTENERDYAWVRRGMIFPFVDYVDRFQEQSELRGCNPGDFQMALEEALLADQGFTEKLMQDIHMAAGNQTFDDSVYGWIQEAAGSSQYLDHVATGQDMLKKYRNPRACVGCGMVLSFKMAKKMKALIPGDFLFIHLQLRGIVSSTPCGQSQFVLLQEDAVRVVEELQVEDNGVENVFGHLVPLQETAGQGWDEPLFGEDKLKLHFWYTGNEKTKYHVIEAETDCVRQVTTLLDLVHAANVANFNLRALDIFASVIITLDSGLPELPGSTIVKIKVVKSKSPLTAKLGTFTKAEARSSSVEGSLKYKTIFGYGDIWDASLAYACDNSAAVGLRMHLPRFRGRPTPFSLRVYLSTQAWLKLSSYKERPLGVSLGLLSSKYHELVYTIAWRNLIDPSQMASRTIRNISPVCSLELPYQIELSDPVLTTLGKEEGYHISVFRIVVVSLNWQVHFMEGKKFMPNLMMMLFFKQVWDPGGTILHLKLPANS